ncbi:hypothetical protein B0H34DRAFT_861250 [Crassisporium funariophilum]|nr:hypothetical protein B0H34DRAFT_861250 [Crassisporium funariophilum]
MAPPAFDYSNGRAVVQHGSIFYSPNCSRPVDIPQEPVHSSDPFRWHRLDVSMFKQPVWWDQNWAWRSFIPLAPSFLFAPFEPLCAMPRIEEVRFSFPAPSGEMVTQIRFRLPEDDIRQWLWAEDLIVKAAYELRLRYSIAGNSPPKPSSFHFDRAHKSHPIAKRMACLARDWFAVWMGYLAFIIAKSENRVAKTAPADPSSAAPDWYSYLLKQPEFDELWLDGLSQSAVCTFDWKTPRAGIIFQWSVNDRDREPIEWYSKHNIPLWFIWSNREEQAIRNNTDLNFLRPPDDLIQEALNILFAAPGLPLAGLIIQKYFALGNDPITNKTIEFLRLQYAPTFVFEYTAKRFINQEALLQETEATADARLEVFKVLRDNTIKATAHAASSYPYHGLSATAAPHAAPSVQSQDVPATVRETGRNYNEFFAAREKRQQEMIKLESAVDRQRRESREQKPGVVNATIYEWEKTQSSGGLELYKRVKVNKKANETVFHSYRSHQRLFNAFSNEWDLCEDFQFGIVDNTSYSDDGYDSGNDDVYPVNAVSQPTKAPPSAAPIDTDMGQSWCEYSRAPLETMSLVYGYVPHAGETDIPPTLSWERMLNFMGFVRNLEELDVGEPERSAMMNFFAAVLNAVNTYKSDKVVAKNFENLSLLFQFEHVRRPTEDLFVFSSPKSDSCRWVLGVHSATAALYVCRYILENPMAHTIVTVAHRLLDRGIPFRTLLPLTCSPRQVTIAEPYVPRSYRLSDHTFTKADFDVAMLACRSVLSSPQGRAALLQGGIVGRIAREYVSKDGVLSGPSIEVTAHRVGYLVPSGDNNIKFCDDQLTANEVAIICGTYSLHTPYKGQVAVWTWFPPPEAWVHNRTGCHWLDWTERCEDIFQRILTGIHDGTGRPRSTTQWLTHLRGQNVSRILIKHNDVRSQQFMDAMVPIGQ